jgi:hypothetical protein
MVFEFKWLKLCFLPMIVSCGAEILGFGADLIGGAKYLWLQQHWTHHAFTNDVRKDPDASVIFLKQFMVPRNQL